MVLLKHFFQHFNILRWFILTTSFICNPMHVFQCGDGFSPFKIPNLVHLFNSIFLYCSYRYWNTAMHFSYEAGYGSVIKHFYFRAPLLKAFWFIWVYLSYFYKKTREAFKISIKVILWFFFLFFLSSSLTVLPSKIFISSCL